MQPKTPKRRSAFRRANRTMPRRRTDLSEEAIDYKNPELLKRFVTESGKIVPRRVTGMSARLHRKITREIKRARADAVDEVASVVQRRVRFTKAGDDLRSPLGLRSRADWRRIQTVCSLERAQCPGSLGINAARTYPSCPS